MAGKYQEQKQHGREGTLARIAARNAKKGQARAAVTSTPELASAPNVVTTRTPEPQPQKHHSGSPGPGITGLADQWLALARDVLGKPPMVNRDRFAERLQESIAKDRTLRKILQQPDGIVQVNDIVSEMIILFWRDVPADGGTQFDFLRDDWDFLVDQAQTSLRVKYLKAHGRLVRPHEVHREDNAFLAMTSQQAEAEWMARALADEDAEPAPARGRSDSLERFRK